MRRDSAAGMTLGLTINVSSRCMYASSTSSASVVTVLRRDRCHLCDDAAGVRLDHLRAIAEINFVAVVVRRIMARRNDNAGACIQMLDCARKLRRGTRAVAKSG